MAESSHAALLGARVRITKRITRCDGAVVESGTIAVVGEVLNGRFTLVSPGSPRAYIVSHVGLDCFDVVALVAKPKKKARS